ERGRSFIGVFRSHPVSRSGYNPLLPAWTLRLNPPAFGSPAILETFMPPASRPLPRRMLLLACLVFASTAAAQAPSFTSGSFFPPKVVLRHAHDKQQLLVSGTMADGSSRDATRDVAYACRDAGVAKVGADGVVTPVGKGTTVINVTAAGIKLAVPVE